MINFKRAMKCIPDFTGLVEEYGGSSVFEMEKPPPPCIKWKGRWLFTSNHNKRQIQRMSSNLMRRTCHWCNAVSKGNCKSTPLYVLIVQNTIRVHILMTDYRVATNSFDLSAVRSPPVTNRYTMFVNNIDPMVIGTLIVKVVSYIWAATSRISAPSKCWWNLKDL